MIANLCSKDLSSYVLLEMRLAKSLATTRSSSLAHRSGTPGMHQCVQSL